MRKTHCKRGHERTPENLQVRSCRQCQRLRGIARDAERRKNDGLNYLLGQLKHNAKKRGHEFALTADDFRELPTHCPILGIRLNYETKGRGLRPWNTASFDRTDSRLGYIPGNVTIISLRANTLKNSASVPEMLKVIRYMWKLHK